MSYECWCDFDPPDFMAVRVVTARKPHRCEECGTLIRPGSKYERTTGKWDGRIDSFVACELCAELKQWARISVPCFCWEFGNLHENVRDMVRDVAPTVPGFFMEYGRRMVKIQRAKYASRKPA